MGTGLAAAGLLGLRPDIASAASQPHIIFILADDLGYGDLGCYGQEKIQTPNLDRMAAEGMRFTQCYSGSTVCAPSRCCLMTGMHTGHARIRGNSNVPLEPEDKTVAEVLKAAGYSTGLIGKWGLGEPETTGIPNKKGFSEFYGYLNQGHAHNYYPEYLWRNDFKEDIPENKDEPEHPGVSATSAVYSHDRFTTEALDFVERRRNSPYFLYLAYTIPHANNERGAFKKDGMEVPDYGPYADKAWSDPDKGRAAMITRMDRDIGALFEKLKEIGMDQNTIVFFSSDNGTHKEGGYNPDFFKSSGPLRGIKRDLYDGGIRVPMIVRAPGRVQPGQVCNDPCAFWDFRPTAADLAGAKSPEGIDGVSMMPALSGGQLPQDRWFYWEFHERGFARAARHGKWKAVQLAPDKPIELYDLDTDTGEKTDLAGKNPEIVKQFTDYFATARTESPHWPRKKKD
jgi:arylsulfatase A-like enzyme